MGDKSCCGFSAPIDHSNLWTPKPAGCHASTSRTGRVQKSVRPGRSPVRGGGPRRHLAHEFPATLPVQFFTLYRTCRPLDEAPYEVPAPFPNPQTRPEPSRAVPVHTQTTRPREQASVDTQTGRPADGQSYRWAGMYVGGGQVARHAGGNACNGRAPDCLAEAQTTRAWYASEELWRFSLFEFLV